MEYAMGIICGLLIVYIIVTVNKIIKANNKVKEAFSTMDVYLKKRWDLIPNLVNTTKAYAKYESETLEGIVKERTNYAKLSMKDKLSSNEEISSNLNKLLALAESYPELKANENFLDLSKQLTTVEDEIAHSRKYYNASVREFNNRIEMVPSNIVAKIFGYKSKNMFEATAEEKENIKIEM